MKIKENVQYIVPCLEKINFKDNTYKTKYIPCSEVKIINTDNGDLLITYQRKVFGKAIISDEDVRRFVEVNI